jgi:glycosyltransferase involved in cell wall biosynthesis
VIGRALRRLKPLPSDGKSTATTDNASVFAWGKGLELRWERYLDRRRPDVVLAHWAPNAMAAIGACRGRGIPLVTHFHGYDASILMRNELYRSRLRSLFGEVAAVVCVSSYQAGVLSAAGCPAEKLHVIPCGAPMQEFKPSEAVLRQPCRFVSVARLAPCKGPLVTLEAFRRVHEDRPAVRITFVGDGPLQGAMSSFVAEHRLQEAVSMAGAVPAPAVSGILANSAVFVQASMSDEQGAVEGWGVSVAEGLATGLPAIVTRFGGLTDLVTDGWNGFLFEEGDSRGMAESMLRLADNPQLRAEMGIRGRQHVEDVGNTEKNTQRLAAVLRAACQS